MSRTVSSPAAKQVFRHEAMFYEDLAQFLAGTVRFLREGIEAGEPALVVVDAAKIEALRAELGNDAARVQFADMANVGRNPARIIPAWKRFTDENLRPGSPVRGIGEPIWAGRSSAELIECQGHETLLNVAFDDGPAWTLLCPYDTVALPADVIAEAQRSHPVLVRHGSRSSSGAYLHEHPAPARWDQPLPPPPPGASRYTAGPGWETLAAIRQAARTHAVRAGLPADSADSFTVAVSEIASNALTHGGQTATVHLWVDGHTVLCDVTDEGQLDAPPLLGRQEPTLQQAGGRGLWLANQLCDLVQVRTGPGGTTVRLHAYL
ncbi:sensor histidine kinase [Allorhizocola rhizosphaerae]|uniref:sensor histidine kinase n=1 Tax=Allorhizocola rhizosphaerae TaxID=1872709 RepID=UPI000E3C9FE6|nr:sensor histidine kinase [Allorhizocola rhizosphaerae]